MGATVEVAYADQGDTGAQTALKATETDVQLVVGDVAHSDKGLSSCPDCGWWSGRLRGCRDSDAWERTWSVYQQRWSVFIS